MKIKKIKLRNFRNYDLINLDFNSQLNIITGDNAQGKTNLIESILYLSTTKSHRINDENLLINKDKEYSDICCELENKNLRILIQKNGKNLFINQKNINKVSDFIGELNAILFCPNDLNLFNQSPKYRRKFVDIEISKLSKHYTNLLKEYYKLLKIRNSYLKHKNINFEYLDIVTEKMIVIQKVILNQRSKFIKDLVYYSNQFFFLFTNQENLISCIYSSFMSDENFDEEKIKLKYQESLEKDLLLKQTNIGIHKDDFIFKMSQYNIEEYCSQGQKRIVLLSIKLGLLMIIHKVIKEYPILLLDDVFSELDIVNQKKLMEIIPKDVQTFITTCSKDVYEFEQNRDTTFFKIINGKVE